MGKVDEAREDMKEIYLAAKDDHYHIKALKLTIRLHKMEPAERSDFLSSLNAYCDALGLTGQANLLGDITKVPQPTIVRSPAWEGGRLAAHDGISHEDNPWWKQDARYVQWADGHAAGKQEIADGLADPPAPKRGRKRNGASSEPAELPPAA